mgnify:FL=1
MSIAVKAILELAVVLLLIYGYIHEKEIIKFEVAVRKAIRKRLKSKRKCKVVKYDILECEDETCVYLIPRK